MIENGAKNMGWNFSKKRALLRKEILRWLKTMSFNQWVIMWNLNIHSTGSILEIY